MIFRRLVGSVSKAFEAKLAYEYEFRAHQLAAQMAEAVFDERMRERYAEVVRVGKLLDKRKGYMTRAKFKKILACLSPDGRLNLTDAFCRMPLLRSMRWRRFL